MDDNSAVPPTEVPPDSSLSPPPRRTRFIRRHWLAFLLIALVVVPFAIFTIWAGITLSFSYSSGERMGFVQKLSRKGWLCKTWEGELQLTPVPGTVPALFTFSIRSDSIAHEVEAAAGKQVALRYEEHRGVPTRCFGETPYFVVGVRVLGDR